MLQTTASVCVNVSDYYVPQRSQEFDTVLAATGRTADTQGLGLESVGVALTKRGKMLCRNEETTVPGVFGIGDAVEGVPELTPSAIQAGRLLAMRLFDGENGRSS